MKNSREVFQLPEVSGYPPGGFKSTLPAETIIGARVWLTSKFFHRERVLSAQAEWPLVLVHGEPFGQQTEQTIFHF